MAHVYGPWATAMASAQLSSFWRRRMSALPTLATTHARRGRGLGLVGWVLLGVPLALPQARDPAQTTPDKTVPPLPRVPSPMPPPAGEPVEKLAVRMAMHKAYALADNEVIKFIRAPFPPERDIW